MHGDYRMKWCTVITEWSDARWLQNKVNQFLLFIRLLSLESLLESRSRSLSCAYQKTKHFLQAILGSDTVATPVLYNFKSVHYLCLTLCFIWLPIFSFLFIEIFFPPANADEPYHCVPLANSRPMSKQFTATTPIAPHLHFPLADSVTEKIKWQNSFKSKYLYCANISHVEILIY
jgi:hypothetical protein